MTETLEHRSGPQAGGRYSRKGPKTGSRNPLIYLTRATVDYTVGLVDYQTKWVGYLKDTNYKQRKAVGALSTQEKKAEIEAERIVREEAERIEREQKEAHVRAVIALAEREMRMENLAEFMGLDRTFETADGRIYNLRQVKPEDVDGIRALHESLSQCDIRTRFFGTMPAKTAGDRGVEASSQGEAKSGYNWETRDWVATTLDENGAEEIVGTCGYSYVPLTDADREDGQLAIGDMSITLSPDHRGGKPAEREPGSPEPASPTTLAEALWTLGLEAGRKDPAVDFMSYDVLNGNRRMASLARRCIKYAALQPPAIKNEGESMNYLVDMPFPPYRYEQTECIGLDSLEVLTAVDDSVSSIVPDEQPSLKRYEQAELELAA